MALAQLPLDCDPHVIADWFEFNILSSEYSLQQLRLLQRTWDKRKNSEDSSPDGRMVDDDASDENFLELITSEFQDRLKKLGDNYPFKFSNTEEELELKSELSDGAILYLFCLYLSGANNSQIFDLENFDYSLDNRVRDLFQACSTWAAAGITLGCSIAFGFPRPDGTSFLTKLRECYSIFGEGEVRDTLLPGVSTSPKDEGIDVIAWTPRSDKAPGKFYVLGQVATGGNWPSKSVKEYFRPFHENWFSVIPSSEPTPFMFIPFCIPGKNADLNQQIAILTKRYGSIHYRYTIPSYADVGLKLSSSRSDLTIERTEEMEDIKIWVNEITDKLRKGVKSVCTT